MKGKKIKVKPKMPILNVTPKSDRVIVMQVDAEKVSQGGIIIPDTALEENRPFIGLVVAVGPGTLETTLDGKIYRIPMDIEKNSMVLYGKYAGSEWTDEETGNKYLIMRMTDISAELHDYVDAD